MDVIISHMHVMSLYNIVLGSWKVLREKLTREKLSCWLPTIRTASVRLYWNIFCLWRKEKLQFFIQWCNPKIFFEPHAEKCGKSYTTNYGMHICTVKMKLIGGIARKLFGNPEILIFFPYTKH